MKINIINELFKKKHESDKSSPAKESVQPTQRVSHGVIALGDKVEPESSPTETTPSHHEGNAANEQERLQIKFESICNAIVMQQKERNFQDNLDFFNQIDNVNKSNENRQ